MLRPHEVNNDLRILNGIEKTRHNDKNFNASERSEPCLLISLCSVFSILKVSHNKVTESGKVYDDVVKFFLQLACEKVVFFR